MDPLPSFHRSFRDLVEADLRRAARLIIKIQDEIDWHFRMATPEGDYAIAVTMPNDNSERQMMLRQIETLMIWKQVTAFTLAVETYEPEAVYCAGISASERISCMARINREPRPWTAANFAALEWLPEDSIDPMIIALLPQGSRPLTPKEVAGCNKWFGDGGRFPAVHILSGEVRGL